jgi:hypothetical protein
MRLPGTQTWSKEDVEAQIAFETGFAEDAPYLVGLFHQASGEGAPFDIKRPPDTEAIFAIGRAAELAFATENISRGVSICAELIKREYPRTPMQAAYYAAVGAVIGALEVQLHAEGVSMYGGLLPKEGLRVAWPHDDSAFAVALMRLFLPAAAASGGLTKTVYGLESWLNAVKPQALAAFGASIELRALLPSKEPVADFSQSSALLTMEDSYAAHLSLMWNDRHHWEMLQPKAPIIDWPLLCTWVAFFRFNEPSWAEHKFVPRSAAAEFIRWLGQELK